MAIRADDKFLLEKYYKLKSAPRSILNLVNKIYGLDCLDTDGDDCPFDATGDFSREDFSYSVAGAVKRVRKIRNGPIWYNMSLMNYESIFLWVGPLQGVIKRLKKLYQIGLQNR